MIGNDLVNIALFESSPHWKSQRYLDKLFTEKEQSLILQAENRASSICQLWSMKESAYKIVSRQLNQRFYAPKQFECSLNSLISGLVQFKNDLFFSTSQVTANTIHTYATTLPISQDEIELKTGLFQSKSSHYDALQQSLSSELDLAKYESKVSKTAIGTPYVLDKSGNKFENFSMSHHGEHWAISILKAKK